MRGEWGGLSIPEHQSKVCVGGSGHSRGQHSPAAAPGAGETPGASPGEAQCSATAPVHHSFAPCLQEGGNAGSSVVENGVPGARRGGATAQPQRGSGEGGLTAAWGARTEQSHVQEHRRAPIGTGGGSAPPHTAEHQAVMLAA